MKVLLTNDDGIQAQGLNTLRRALLEAPGVELSVIAPDSNRSATARSITTHSPLWVEEIEFEDGSTGFELDLLHPQGRMRRDAARGRAPSSEEHTPELQSR